MFVGPIGVPGYPNGSKIQKQDDQLKDSVIGSSMEIHSADMAAFNQHDSVPNQIDGLNIKAEEIKVLETYNYSQTDGFSRGSPGRRDSQLTSMT
jgi:hypothetical protein